MALKPIFQALFGGGQGVSSSTGRVVVGSQTVTGSVPAGATANFKKNGTVVGAATVTPTGIASYGPVTLVAGDAVSFPWTLTGESPASVATVAPTLGALTLSPSSATVGVSYSGTVSGRTSGSTLSLTGAGAAGLSISGSTITGTPTTAGPINIVETLAGATGSPRTSSGVMTVAAAPVQPTLGTLTLSSTSAAVGTAYSGTISGQTSGSTITLSGAGAAGLSVSGSTVSGTPTATGAVNLIETLSGATNTPNTTSNALTVSASSVSVPAAPTITLTAGNAQVSVAWTDGATNGAAITSHKLYRGTVSGSRTLVGTITTASPYVDTGLTNGTAYFYSLSAVNSAGEGPQSAEVTATPAVTLPSGADGLWMMSDYSLADRGATGLTSGVVKNRMASTAPSKNLFSVSRGNFTSLNNGGNMTVTLGATAADGSNLAVKLSWGSGDQYYQHSNPSLPAGTYTLSFDAFSDDGTSSYPLRMGLYNGPLTSITVTPTKQRFTTTFTLASAGGGLVLPRTASGNTTSGAIRIDNITLHQGSTDLGPDTLAGHLYLGTTAADAAPAVASGGILQMANNGGGVIAFPVTKTLSAFTVVMIGARGGTAAQSNQQSVLTNPGSGYTNFSATFDDGNASGGRGQFSLGGSTLFNGDFFGLWMPRASEYHAITNRYGNGAASIFMDEAKTHDTASTGLSTSVQTMWYSWVLGQNLYLRYKVAAFALWPRALSDAEVRQATAYLKAQVASNGVTFPSNRVILVAEGDSITAGSTATTNYPNSAAASFTKNANGVVRAVASATLAGNNGNSLQGRAATDDAIIPPDKQGAKYALSILIGKNDLQGYSGGTSQYLTDLVSYISARRAAGWDRIILCLLLPSTVSGWSTVRAQFNSAVTAAGWSAANGVDVICDFASVSGMGADTDASNTTNYTDGTHPTTTGQGLLAPAYATAVNALAA